MKHLSSQALKPLYSIIAIILPLSAIVITFLISQMSLEQQLEYKVLYDIAIIIASTGVTILFTFFFLSKADSMRTMDSITESLRNPHLPLSGAIRSILRDVLVNTDTKNNVSIFRDHHHAYEALVNDIQDGEISLTNTIFVTDDPDAKYDVTNDERKKWIDTIRNRLAERSPKGHGSSFTLNLIEAPKGGSADFLTDIGGLKAIQANNGRVFSLNIPQTHAKFMANFVLIKKDFSSSVEYIVYFGWFTRAPGSIDYPNPCARIASEHLYKFLQQSYCHALTISAAKGD